MDKPKVGQIVYSLNVGNAARYREQVLTEYIVSKVGRKYFTIQRPGSSSKCTENQFYIDDWRQKTEYTPDHSLYSSKQEWRDEKESKKICRKIYEAFNYGRNTLNLDLESLREIEHSINVYAERAAK